MKSRAALCPMVILNWGKHKCECFQIIIGTPPPPHFLYVNKSKSKIILWERISCNLLQIATELKIFVPNQKFQGEGGTLFWLHKELMHKSCLLIKTTHEYFLAIFRWNTWINLDLLSLDILSPIFIWKIQVSKSQK